MQQPYAPFRFVLSPLTKTDDAVSPMSGDDSVLTVPVPACLSIPSASTSKKTSRLQKLFVATNSSSSTTANCDSVANTCVPLDVPTEKPQATATLLWDKYLILNSAEGSSLHQCVNVHNNEEFVCKIVAKDKNNLLTSHYRLDGVAHMNPIQEVLVGVRYVYLIFPKSHGDLHSFVRMRRRVRESEAKRLFRQIAETVKTCHENGIVLRDLKLRKFVFADDQKTQLKLESLEDAVVLDDPEDDVLDDKRGCPAYVSPEILRAGARYSGKVADMWSLGVILFTMLAGRYPFSDSEHVSLFAKISRGHYVMPDCLSSRAKCLIRSLLTRDPRERLTSEDILDHPWLKPDERSYSYVASVFSSRNTDQLVPEWNSSNEDE